MVRRRRGELNAKDTVPRRRAGEGDMRIRVQRGEQTVFISAGNRDSSNQCQSISGAGSQIKIADGHGSCRGHCGIKIQIQQAAFRSVTWACILGTRPAVSRAVHEYHLPATGECHGRSETDIEGWRKLADGFSSRQAQHAHGLIIRHYASGRIRVIADVQ